jgi:hypothetical protein
MRLPRIQLSFSSFLPASGQGGFSDLEFALLVEGGLIAEKTETIGDQSGNTSTRRDQRDPRDLLGREKPSRQAA